MIQKFKFNTYDNSYPFSTIDLDTFEQMIIDLIKKSKDNIIKIIENPNSPTFNNTIEAIENASSELDRHVNAIYNLYICNTNDKIDKIINNISLLHNEYKSWILYNEELFKRIEIIYNNRYGNDFTQEEFLICQDIYNTFIKNGIKLSIDDKNEINRLKSELTELEISFSKNALSDTNSEFLQIENISDLDGLPNNYIEEAKLEANTRNLTGYVFPTKQTVAIPFLKYIKNREKRKEFYILYSSIGNRDNTYNNEEVIKQIIEKRKKLANILGFENYSDYILEDRMANFTSITNMYNTLLEKSLALAKDELEAIRKVSKLDKIEQYDHLYYSNILKEELYSYSEEEVKEYLSIENCLNSIQSILQQYFHLSLNKIDTVDKYHNDVITYEVFSYNTNRIIGILYLDLYERPNKQSGAWMTTYKEQSDNKANRPHVSIVCNFSNPTDELPSLLTFRDFETLFHEFGHALHSLFSNVKYEYFSGTNVKLDFVELPSQLMENFCYENLVLSQLTHYKNGNVIPGPLVINIIKSKKFLSAYNTIRQIKLGKIDLAFHRNELNVSESIFDFEERITNGLNLYDSIENCIISSNFSHIFGGGYASGYYSYKWSEVMEADVFNFLKTNSFKYDLMIKYKNLLKHGGTEDPNILYRELIGRSPNVDFLLKKML